MPPVELALRTGAAAILLLTGVVILRDRRRMDSKGAGGLLALSVAADSIVAVSGGPSVPGVWPLVLIAMGIPAMLWIWVGAGFAAAALLFVIRRGPAREAEVEITAADLEAVIDAELASA